MGRGEKRESGLRDKCGISGLNGRRVLRVASFKEENRRGKGRAER